MELLAHAASQAGDGLVLEFGVFIGTTTRWIASLMPGRRVYGFDSFQGLPEPWADLPAGEFRLSEPPNLGERIELVVGWFADTLPKFVADHAGESAAFVHFDCDLYSSAKTVLNLAGSMIRPGTVIVFDEYRNYPGWQDHEHRAFQEFLASTGMISLEIGSVVEGQQVAFLMT